MVGKLKEIQEKYNVKMCAEWKTIMHDLDASGFAIDDIVIDRQGDAYKITHREPKSYKFGESTRTFCVRFLGVKLLKATGTFGQYTHCIIF